MLSRRTLIGSLAALAVVGCSNSDTGAQLKSSAALLDLSADTPAVASIADSLRALCWGWIHEGDGNRLVSPSSFGLALGMLGEGATGESATVIDELFGVTGHERSEALGGWKQSLDEFDELPDEVDVQNPPKTPIVHLGAQAVVVGGKGVEQDYLDRLASHYGAGAVAVDSWEELKPVLDAFAKKETAGLIEESGIVAKPELKLVLQDALLFAAAWATEFEHDQPMEFHAPDGTVEVDGLFGTFFATVDQSPHADAVRLPFTERFAMDVILPAGDVDAFSAETLQAVTDALDKGQEAELTLTMPKSEQTAKMDLKQPLADLGIVPGTYDDIFGGAFVSQVVQQTKLIVGAKGAVGAALTEIALAESAPAMPELELTVDRPYILQLIDTEHGWPLFLSVIEDPTQE